MIIEYILTGVGTCLSTMLVYCAYKQNKIQKDNIKIQLFDKRYSIYKSVLDSITIFKRDNWERYILFYENDISKQLIKIEENLYQAVQLSVCLFDKELYEKTILVNDAFCKVADAYKNMLMSALASMNEEKKEEFITIYKRQIVSEQGFNLDEYKEIFPKAYIAMMEFSRKCEDYINLVNKLQIIKSFHKYIAVNGLEK